MKNIKLFAEEVKKELENMAECELVINEVNKNGQILTGITFRTGNICPTIYVDPYLEASAEEAAKQIYEVFKRNSNPDINVAELTDRNFLLNHSRIAFYKSVESRVVNRPSEFDGIIEAVYIRIDSISGFKLTYDVLASAEISEAEIWEQAFENTINTASIKNISEIIGTPYELPMFVVTNDVNTLGASAVLNKQIIKDRMGCDRVTMIPSSIHEVIVIPYEENDTLNDMVNSVNSTELKPDEILSDRVYTITL